ncbi:hypothetical protein RvY_01764 [Ramazzottius varieornatus]|uniref:Uncharacterized protein n=1 Tax=Ramazzottius varieornatus TaxID=947166 RepID=A0A1D1ULA8_RAMVA|nr:hypothetical protein RvY_01764 [Ramazzottius varieornatus]
MAKAVEAKASAEAGGHAENQKTGVASRPAFMNELGGSQDGTALEEPRIGRRGLCVLR